MDFVQISAKRKCNAPSLSSFRTSFRNRRLVLPLPSRRVNRTGMASCRGGTARNHRAALLELRRAECGILAGGAKAHTVELVRGDLLGSVVRSLRTIDRQISALNTSVRAFTPPRERAQRPAGGWLVWYKLFYDSVKKVFNLSIDVLGRKP